jgi:hypothetical protein
VKAGTLTAGLHRLRFSNFELVDVAVLDRIFANNGS